jgi:hypothetical protein
MTLTEFMDHLELTLARAEEGPPVGLRPRGTFVGHPPKGGDQRHHRRSP